MDMNLTIFILLACVTFVNCEIHSDKKSVILPPCLGCKTVVSSFKKAVEKINSSTESEVNKEQRYAAIKEHICGEIDWGKDHCTALAIELSEHLEDWWLNKQESHPDLYEWLCVSKKEVCCPENHFGPDCQPCRGYPERICKGNGKCRGAGTRKGNGSCICEIGYEGDSCDKCAKYFYEAYRDENKLLCAPCHNSCQGICTQAGPKGCAACKQGWRMDTEKGCVDIDECYETKNLCTKNQFCVNNDGSYVCLECDRSCSGCHGDGPDMCKKCAKGYAMKDNMCIDVGDVGRDWHISVTRYMTYAGLCIATCIIFQKNMVLAGIIGLSVGVYISVAEYFLGSPQENNNVDIAKLLGLQT